MRRWLAISCYAACIAALTACGDDDGSDLDPGVTPDASVADGGSRDGGSADGGGSDDGGMTDPCAGRSLCEVEGTTCDGATLVTCAEDADGCLVETRNSCAMTDQVCDASGGTAACVDPCSLIPESQRCTTAGRSCDDDVLEICEADAQGCLVRTVTNCSESLTGGICNPAGGDEGDMARCEAPPVDPCDGIVQCAGPSRACNSDNTGVVVCAADAMGCFVETTMACSGVQVCDATGGTATCVTPRGANNSCATAESITGSRRITNEDLSLGGARPTATSCGSGPGTRTLYYEVTIPAFTIVHVQTTPRTDIVLMVLDQCDASACSYSTDATPEQATLTNSGSTPITRIVAIRPYSASTGSYDIEFTYSAIPEGGACMLSRAITGTTRVSVDTAMGGARPTGTGCISLSSASGGAHWFDVTLQPGEVVSVTTASSLDRVLSMVDACGATGCTFSTDTEPESARLVNDTDAPITRHIVVYPWDTSNGTIDVDFTYGTPAPNAACGTAELVTPSGSLSFTGEQLAVGGARPTGTNCRTSGTDTALYYAVQIPPMTSVQAVATTPPSGANIAMVALDACDAAACSQQTDTAPETLRVVNSTNETVTRYIAVHGSTNTTVAGTYDIAFSYAPLAANAACATAEVITSSMSFTGESTTAGGARPAGTGCAANTSGDGTLYYAVQIEPGSAVDVTTTGSLDRVLVVQDACGATSCSYHTNTPPESARLVNATDTTMTRIVAVHPSSSTASDTFDISFTYIDVASNAACEGAASITPATPSFTGESLAAGGARPTGTGCSTVGTNRALYYAVTIPPLHSVDLVATPTNGTNIVLQTLDACDAGACAWASGTGSGPKNTRFVNATESPVTQWVSVAAASTSGAAPQFNIAASYVPFAPNAVCSAAEPVSGSRFITGEVIANGGPRPTGAGCGTSAGNSALYYSVTVPAMSAVEVTVTPAASVDTVLLVQDECDAACTQRVNASAGQVERATLLNETSSPITRIVAVHNNPAATTGTFSIAFEERAIVCGDGNVEGGEQCDDGNLLNTDGCSSSCTVEPNFVCTGSPSSCRAVAPNAICENATEITASQTIGGENPLMGGPRPEGTGCGTLSNDGQSRALYYSVVIPPQTRVEVTTGGDIDRVLLTQDACGDGVCTYRTDAAPERATLRNDTLETITRIVAIHPYSTGTSPWSVSFAYHAYVCGDGQVEGIERCDDGNSIDEDGCTACIPDPGYACVGTPSVCVGGAPPNAYCPSAEPITPSTPILTGETTAAGGPRPTGASCGSGSGSRALYYAVTIPPGQQVIAEASNVSGDVVVFSMSDCDQTACLASGDDPDRVIVNNLTSSEVTRIVGVRSYSATASTYDISFTYGDYTGVSLPATIPDGNEAGIDAAIRVNDCPVVESISMSIDIRHTWRGDLRVRLTGPAGVTRTLWSESDDDDSDDLIGTFNTTLAPSGTGAVPISEFIGEPGTGLWTLNVADVESYISGTLQSWSLNVTCSSAP